MTMNPIPAIADAFSLNGKVAVVTGAASGLGQGAAQTLARAGARVVLADIDEEGLNATAAAIAETGGEAIVKRTDVSNLSDLDALADTALRSFDRLDSWINCAGVPLWAGLLEASPGTVQRVLSINMLGTYWGCVTAARIMQKRKTGGTIVNVSSTAGDTPVPGLGVYGMTKAAVNQLTRVSAREFGKDGIRVNAVVPGWFDTPINSSMYVDAEGKVDHETRDRVVDEMAALSPLGLTGKASDFGLAVLYLVSDASRFVTGHLLRVSGGV
jgi:3-oxoacyl-[acyl-carrier protein] reductase